jgi:hypothetical protein
MLVRQSALRSNVNVTAPFAAASVPSGRSSSASQMERWGPHVSRKSYHRSRRHVPTKSEPSSKPSNTSVSSAKKPSMGRNVNPKTTQTPTLQSLSREKLSTKGAEPPSLGQQSVPDRLPAIEDDLAPALFSNTPEPTTSPLHHQEEGLEDSDDSFTTCVNLSQETTLAMKESKIVTRRSSSGTSSRSSTPEAIGEQHKRAFNIYGNTNNNQIENGYGHIVDILTDSDDDGTDLNIDVPTDPSIHVEAEFPDKYVKVGYVHRCGC